MAYTFGGAVGSRCSVTSLISLGATATAGVVTGWYYPTTLTATRRYWGAGTIFGARVAATTSEIELLTDNATTDGLWTTSGAGIATGNWYFLAVIWANNNTGPATSWRVYLGTPDTAPALVSLTTTTSPVGNFTGSATYVQGNTSASNVSFQGEITDTCLIATSTFNATTSPLGIAASTTITAAEEANILNRYILPLWAGDPARAANHLPQAPNTFDFMYWPATLTANVQRRGSGITALTWIAPTLTSAVYSAGGSPRPQRSVMVSHPFVPH